MWQRLMYRQQRQDFSSYEVLFNHNISYFRLHIGHVVEHDRQQIFHLVCDKSKYTIWMQENKS